MNRLHNINAFGSKPQPILQNFRTSEPRVTIGPITERNTMTNYPYASMRDTFDLTAYCILGSQDTKGRPIGDIVDDAVYNRNSAVEELLGISFRQAV